MRVLGGDVRRWTVGCERSDPWLSSGFNFQRIRRRAATRSRRPPSAFADFSDDEVFTVFGGGGNAFFYPCVSGTSHNGGSASISFGTFGGPCLPPGSTFLGEHRFTFGVPQIVHVSASLLSVGVMFFLAMRIRGMQKFNRCTLCKSRIFT